MVLVLEKISFGYICLEEFRVCIYRIELDGNITTQLPTISAMHELNLCLITEDSLKLCSRCHITHLAIHCTAMITVADNPIATCLAARSCRTRTLAGITFGWYDFEARMYDPAIGRFMQTDPMAEKYYWISPYAYCANNPIKFVDPTGEDIWEINNEGRIINRIKDKSQDAFYMVEQDADGNYQRTFTTDAEGNKIYNSISFEYGTIKSQRSISFSPDGQTTDTYDVYRIRGDNNGTALFEFMSNNISGSRTGVEISQAMTGIKGDKGLNFITTGHTKAKEPGMTHLLMGQLLNGYTIRELNHSHPYTPNPSSSDKRFASQIKDIMKQRNISVPEFNLYYVPDKQKIPFGR